MNRPLFYLLAGLLGLPGARLDQASDFTLLQGVFQRTDPIWIADENIRLTGDFIIVESVTMSDGVLQLTGQISADFLNPAAPTITIQQTGADVILSWAVTGFVLEETIALGSNTIWNEAFPQSSEQTTARLPIAAGPRYFRLRSR